MEPIGSDPGPCQDGASTARAAEDAPFAVIQPLRRTAPVVFASPHSGRRYPPGFLAMARASVHSLRCGEDAYVDELFAGAARAGAPLLIATYGRAYVDLNRPACDLDPDLFDGLNQREPPSPRVRAGLGVVPRIAGDGAPIYAGRLPAAEAEKRLALVHRPYHAKLAALIEETKALFGVAVLVDCHSMPSSARGPGAPDIVLGDRFGRACAPTLVDMLEQTLRQAGYRVARNAPFAGGWTTQAYGRPDAGTHAVQIEVCRGLYMDERTLQPRPGFARLRTDLADLAERLARFDHARLLPA